MTNEIEAQDLLVNALKEIVRREQERVDAIRKENPHECIEASVLIIAEDALNKLQNTTMPTQDEIKAAIKALSNMRHCSVSLSPNERSAFLKDNDIVFNCLTKYLEGKE